MTESYNILTPPIISEEQLTNCQKSDDYRSVLFLWYKYVSELCQTFAQINHTSVMFIQIEPIHHAILMGLLNRCAKLMFANTALSQGGLFGEATSIIDRCIIESSVKVNWLCQQPSPVKFNEFIADGLDTILKFKKKINTAITERADKAYIIEKKILASLELYLSSSNLSEDSIRTAKALPNFSEMCKAVNDDLFYFVVQKFGSDHVHGTWASLLLHYIFRDENGYFTLRGHECLTTEEQYFFIPLTVLKGLDSFVHYIFKNNCKKDMVDKIDFAKNEIYKLRNLLIGNAFDHSVKV